MWRRPRQQAVHAGAPNLGPCEQREGQHQSHAREALMLCFASKGGVAADGGWGRCSACDVHRGADSCSCARPACLGTSWLLQVAPQERRLPPRPHQAGGRNAAADQLQVSRVPKLGFDRGLSRSILETSSSGLAPLSVKFGYSASKGDGGSGAAYHTSCRGDTNSSHICLVAGHHCLFILALLLCPLNLDQRMEFGEQKFLSLHPALTPSLVASPCLPLS